MRERFEASIRKLKVLGQYKTVLLACVLLFNALYVISFSQKYFDGNISGLLFIGTSKTKCPDGWYPGLYVRKDEGYDGELTYYMAVDLFRTKGIYDCTRAGAYRYQRILMPLLASICSFGQRHLVPYAIVGLNLCSLVLATFFLIKLCDHFLLSRLTSLFFSFSVMTFVALTRSTLEIFYCSLLVIAFYNYIKEEYFKTAIFLSLAMLAKEQGMAAAGGIFLYELIFKRKLKNIKILLIPFLICMIWQSIIFVQFRQDVSNSGFPLRSNWVKESTKQIPFEGLFYRISSHLSASVASPIARAEIIILANIFFAISLILYSLRASANSPFPIVGLFYIVLLQIAQSIPPSAYDLYAYGRQSAEIFVILIFLYCIRKKKIFLVPLAVNSLAGLFLMFEYLYYYYP